MKQILIALAIVLLVTGTATADPSGEYNGTWTNVDTDTRGITKIVIHVGDSKNGLIYYVQVWGKCHPEDCDWGTEGTNSYSDGHLTARYENNYSIRDLTITKTGSNTLEVKAHTRFTDDSGRSEMDATYRFRRLLTPATKTPKTMNRLNVKPSSEEPTGKY
ncbi:MAG: hypothetical protein JW902_06065 [Syntrophaceae bacterium]|nr:hypothetical protein [Syntrophaceae bacterium]